MDTFGKAKAMNSSGVDTRPLYRREGFKSNPDFIRYTFHKLINEEGITDFTKIVDEVKRRCQMIRVNYYFNEIRDELEAKGKPSDESLASELNKLNINDKEKETTKPKKETKEKEIKQEIKVKKVKEDKQSSSSEDYEESDDDAQSSEEEEFKKNDDAQSASRDEGKPSSSKQQQNKQLLKRLNKLTLDLETGINDTYDIIKKVLKDNCSDLDEANNIFDKFEDIIEGIIFLLIEDKIDEVYKDLKKE